MDPVEDFLVDFEGDQGDVLAYLDAFICSCPEIQPRIRYRIPFYYRKSWICYLNPLKDRSVELAFFSRGNELSNVQGLLDAKGRKQVAGVIFHQDHHIPEEPLLEIIQEAI